MKNKNLEALKTFTIENLPDLDVVTLGALELFSSVGELPGLEFVKNFRRPIVVGSGNSEITGKIIFENSDALFADESTCESVINSIDEIDGAILISASGGKHAIELAKNLHVERKLPTWLITNNPDAPAGEHIDKSKVIVFPKNREPYTYNTSTYMGMILSHTKGDPGEVLSFINSEVAPRIPNNLATYDSFYLIIPAHLIIIRDMFLTKFDELFGSTVSGRVFTFEQTKHAKTIVPSNKELFISFGEKNDVFGEQRLYIPLPNESLHGALMAIVYYVIGHIQKQHPQSFKKHIAEYTAQASELFGQTISPIVE